jgi:Zn-dependent alcohol dehydrogenase
VFIRWYREGKLKLNDLVTHRYSLDQINTAVDDLDTAGFSVAGFLPMLNRG